MSTISAQRHDHEQREHDPKRGVRATAEQLAGGAEDPWESEPLGEGRPDLRVREPGRRRGDPAHMSAVSSAWVARMPCIPAVPVVGRGEEGEHRHHAAQTTASGQRASAGPARPARADGRGRAAAVESRNSRSERFIYCRG